MADLTTKFAGIPLKNPLIVGSSGLSDQVSNIKDLEKHGASAVVLKSLFEEEIIRDQKAHYSSMSSGGFVYPETLEFYEHDLPKEATLKYLDLVQDAKKEVNIPIIASINCVDAVQWTYFPKQIENAGADAIELNISILPSDFEKTPEENEETYFKIIREVKSQLSVPVVVKLSYYFSHLGSFLKKVSETGISGMVLFNRFYNPDIDIDKLEITNGAVLSNPGDIYQTLRWIAIMAERASCDLAASTGINDGAGIIKQLLAGANACQVVSAIYRNGPEYIGQMLSELETWMDKKGFDSIDKFRGMMSQSKSHNPAAYSRVQFMKYFRGFPQAGK